MVLFPLIFTPAFDVGIAFGPALQKWRGLVRFKGKRAREESLNGKFSNQGCLGARLWGFALILN